MAKELQRILFVDDDLDIHTIVKICLQDIPGVEVRSVLSGEEAIRLVPDFKPDLILLDVMMPKLDGIGTLEAIKRLPTFSEIPVVFLTAKAQKNEVESYFKYGVVDVITKPFDPMNLSKLILQIWERVQKK